MLAKKFPSSVLIRAVLATCAVGIMCLVMVPKKEVGFTLHQKLNLRGAKNEIPFAVSDFVQKHVLKHCRLKMGRVSRTFVAGSFKIKQANGDLRKFSFSSLRRTARSSSRVRFHLLSSSPPNGVWSKFRGFEILSRGGTTTLFVDLKAGTRMAIRFITGKTLTSPKAKLYEMFLKDPIVGSFIELDIKLGAAGFIGEKNLPVAAISFYANSFAIQSNRFEKTAQWKVNDQEIAKANRVVKATQRLGRSPESMEEMEDSKPVSKYRRRLVSFQCLIAPVFCPPNNPAPAPPPKTCDLVSACGNECLGRCGKGCTCWSWVCGDCNCHCNCRDHDFYCSCKGTQHVECLQMAKYSDCSRSCHVTVPIEKNCKDFCAHSGGAILSGSFRGGGNFALCSANADHQGFRVGFNLVQNAWLSHYASQCRVGANGKEETHSSFKCICAGDLRSPQWTAETQKSCRNACADLGKAAVESGTWSPSGGALLACAAQDPVHRDGFRGGFNLQKPSAYADKCVIAASNTENHVLNKKCLCQS